MLGNPNNESEDIFVQMTMMILDKVDGISMHPKLTVCDRTYYKKYKFNTRVRNATKEIEKEIEILNSVNIFNTAVVNNEYEDAAEI